MSAHTPGPMVADYNTAELPFRIVSKATSGNVGYAYTETDADLFAAAPELLAICKNIVANGIGASDIRAMEAAIAKAEGKQ